MEALSINRRFFSHLALSEKHINGIGRSVTLTKAIDQYRLIDLERQRPTFDNSEGGEEAMCNEVISADPLERSRTTDGPKLANRALVR
jgi:hypothetical protein